MKVTRRALGRILAATAAAAPLKATPQTDADEESRSAREALRNNAEQIAKIPLKMATEPAFTFKA
jgi:hypothetical protein